MLYEIEEVVTEEQAEIDEVFAISFVSVKRDRTSMID